MPSNPFQAEILKPAINHQVIAELVSRQPRFLPEVFGGLLAEKPRIRYGCLKVLRVISESDPAVLYPHFEQLVHLLESTNTFMKWGAILAIGNLAAIDGEGKIERILDLYLAPIAGDELLTAGHAIGGAAKIARAKPELADRIATALIGVERAQYQTPECRNVALGLVVQTLDVFYAHLKQAPPVLDFVQRQLENRRPAVRRKAAAFLRKHGRNESPGANGKRGAS